MATEGTDRIETPFFPRMLVGMRSVLSLLIPIQISLLTDSVAEEWTRFRSPNGSGIGKSIGSPKWPTTRRPPFTASEIDQL